jgi:hypothetical protein
MLSKLFVCPRVAKKIFQKVLFGLLLLKKIKKAVVGGRYRTYN